jgi:RNA polymerase sigma-70 factor (ECF subfamily)
MRHSVICGHSFEATDWPQIVALYDHLFSIMPTPVIALNRAIAIGEIEGPGAALTALEAIAPDLDNYHLMHAARGTTLRGLGRRDAAGAAYERAAHLAATEMDRRFLAQQIEELAKDGALIHQWPGGSTGPSNETRAR